jgi:hypothetical protein
MSESVAPSTPSQGTSEGQASETTENQVQATETPAQAERRKLKAKVNGKEREVYEDDVLRDYQKYASADEKLREAAQKRKDIDRFYEQLENDPESLLNDPRLPINKQELAMKWLTEQIEHEVKYADPKDRELDEIRRELEQFKNRDKEVEETKQQQEHRQLVEQRREAIATTLSEAMALSPLSKDPDTAAATLREMAMHMRLCKDAGYEITPQELAQHVEKKNIKTYHTLAGRLEGDDLISFLGEEIVQKIRRADLSRIKKSREVAKPEVASEWETRNSQPRRFFDPSELRSR